MRARSLLMCGVLLAGPVQASADTAPNAVTDWELIVQQAIHNAAAPRPPASAARAPRHGGAGDVRCRHCDRRRIRALRGGDSCVARS